MSKNEVPAHVTALIAIISIFALVSLIFGGILFYEKVIYKEERKGAVLEVEEVYFVYKGFSDDRYQISVKAFISNVGDENCAVRLRAFAVDAQSNLAMDDAEATVGIIRHGTTEETSFSMAVLYKGTFTIELMIFKDDLLTVKGYGKISLTEHQEGGRDYRDTLQDEPISAPPKANGVPFPTIGIISISVMAAVVTAGALTRRRWRR